MKRLCVLIFLFILNACGSKSSPVTAQTQNDRLFDRKPIFNDCSIIDTSIDEYWILLCQREPHPQRPELYEYSTFFKTFKRLTFQDGIITDVAVLGVEDIVYASTYDEAKEKFLSVAKGLKPGTDLYLRKRTVTDFQRLTRDEGSDHSLFWSKELQGLLFVHSNPQGDSIRIMSKDHKIKQISKPTLQGLSSIITHQDRHFYWLEWYESEKKSYLKTSPEKKFSPTTLFKSATRQLFLRPGADSRELWVSLATGLGTELWSYNLEKKCLQRLLQTQKKWSRFQKIDNNKIEISVEAGSQIRLERVPLKREKDSCESTPTSLGVEI